MAKQNPPPEAEWSKLSAYEHLRRRTEVYFGSRDPFTQEVLEYVGNKPVVVETTWVPAVFTAFREILDNALDEVVTHKHGGRIDVTFDAASLTFSVTDDGRGIPIEWSDEHQNYAATVLLSEMNSGRNFIADRGETRGLNGIGAKGVNFCSEWFLVEVTRNKQTFKQRFSEGDALLAEPPELAATTSRKTGTKISCKLSQKVFHDLRLPESFVAARMREIALCYPELHLTFNGKRVTAGTLFENEAITFAINLDGFKAKFWLVPDFTINAEFAFSLVNAIPLFNGGTHITSYRRSFYPGLLGALERESKRRRLALSRADISDNLLVFVTLEMDAPSFDSQSKSRLINEHVGTLIRTALENPDLYKDLIKKHPFWIDGIYARCAERTRSRDDRDTRKQAKKNLRQKIEELEDACGLDRSKCILMLCEGRSAVSGAAEARDPEVFGALPLRGKVLNVYGESNKTILANDALAKIMGSVGLTPGERANRHNLRYGRIYITCDADEDGKNITALLINFFFSCWPELFDPLKTPFIYVFETPLIIASKGKQRKYWYSNNYDEFDAERMAGWEITRAKGLAALTRDDWKIALAKPQLTPIVDDGRLAETLKLLFSPDANARKVFMGI